FRRVALVVKDDKSSNPLDIGLFCAKAVMLEANAIADARKETRRLRCIGGVHARQARLGSTIFELTIDFWGNYGSTKYDFLSIDAKLSDLLGAVLLVRAHKCQSSQQFDRSIPTTRSPRSPNCFIARTRHCPQWG